MKETLRRIRLPVLALAGVMMFVGAPRAEAKHNHHHHDYDSYSYPTAMTMVIPTTVAVSAVLAVDSMSMAGLATASAVVDSMAAAVDFTGVGAASMVGVAADTDSPSSLSSTYRIKIS